MSSIWTFVAFVFTSFLLASGGVTTVVGPACFHTEYIAYPPVRQSATGLSVHMVRNETDFRGSLGLAFRRHKGRFELEEGRHLNLSFLDDRTASDDARLFAVKKEGKVISTSALLFQKNVKDLLRTGESSGIPEDILRRIRAISQEGIMEISMLATEEGFSRDPRVVRVLMAGQYLYWKTMKKIVRPRYWLITVSPDHASVYKSLGFEQLGEQWNYGGGREACTLVLDTNNLEALGKVEKKFFKGFKEEETGTALTRARNVWIPWSAEPHAPVFQIIVDQFKQDLVQ